MRHAALDLDHLRKRHRRMTDRGELQRHPQSVAILAPLPDQVEVGLFEGETPRRALRALTGARGPTVDNLASRR